MPPPAAIGPYTIEGCLIKGVWSCLYLARDEKRVPVVVKALSERFVDQREAQLRFQKEAQILEKVSHPFIVKLLTAGVHENMPYIAMEFLEGVSLREWILYRPLSLSQAIHLILDIAYAICHLHTHGVVHRDLKPENILLTPDRVPKLIDFGIARLLSDDETPTQEPTTIMGTPVYMSPEQRDHPQYVSYASDLYSLGIIAYEIILGRLSHGHIQLSLMPKGIQKILRRMLQSNIQDRYPDVVDFIIDLSTYLNGPSFPEEAEFIQPLYPFWESLQRISQVLVPTQFPPSSTSSSAVAFRDRTTTWGVYIDKIMLSQERDEELFILAESCKAGAEGIAAVSALRAYVKGMMHPAKTVKEQLYEIQQHMLLNGNLEGLFFFYALHLVPSEKRIEVFCYGTNEIFWIEDGRLFFIEDGATPTALFGMPASNTVSSLEKPYHPTRRWIIPTHSVIEKNAVITTNYLYTPLAWKEKLLTTATCPLQEQAAALMKLQPRQELVNIHAPMQACFILQE